MAPCVEYLLDYAVNPQHKRRRKLYSEGLGGSCIEHQLKGRGHFNRNIAWLGPFENLVDVPDDDPENFGGIDREGNQAAGLDKFSDRVHCRNFRAPRKFNQLLALLKEERIGAQSTELSAPSI